MNKKQIKQTIEIKRDKKLKEIKEQYQIDGANIERLVIDELLSTEIKEYDDALLDLKLSKEFKTFYKKSRNLIDRVGSSKFLSCLNSYSNKDFYKYIRLISEDTYNFDIYKKDSWNSVEPRIKKVDDDYYDLKDSIKNEYGNLLQYLKSVTAKVFIEYMKEIGLDLTIEDETVYMYPAPKFNLELLK